MPLRELMRGFFDKLKSVSSGCASLSYRSKGCNAAGCHTGSTSSSPKKWCRHSRDRLAAATSNRRRNRLVEKLEEFLPRQMFELKIQAKAGRPHHRRTP